MLGLERGGERARRRDRRPEVRQSASQIAPRTHPASPASMQSSPILLHPSMPASDLSWQKVAAIWRGTLQIALSDHVIGIGAQRQRARRIVVRRRLERITREILLAARGVDVAQHQRAGFEIRIVADEDANIPERVVELMPLHLDLGSEQQRARIGLVELDDVIEQRARLLGLTEFLERARVDQLCFDIVPAWTDFPLTISGSINRRADAGSLSSSR